VGSGSFEKPWTVTSAPTRCGRCGAGESADFHVKEGAPEQINATDAAGDGKRIQEKALDREMSAVRSVPTPLSTLEMSGLPVRRLGRSTTDWSK
jgi:hypothetical protein